ncbi:EAL domain-containing protein [Undibacterium arcticum]
MRLIVALSKALNLETVAEGVETIEHVKQLNRLGCNLGQGYAFSPAISADEAEELLRFPRNFLVA